jgi:ABC-type nitrate/sulfonate/bicarbonate transport system substrate-binding protein
MNKYGLKVGATVASLMLSLVSLGGVVKADSAVELTKSTTPIVTTSIARDAKVSKTKIVETSVKTEISTVVKKEKNATKSTKTTDGALKTVTSTPLVKVTAKTSVTVKKTATETITETKTVTTKVETFNKAKKGKLKFKLATASDGMSGVPVREALERLNFKYGYQGELVFVSNSDLVIAGGASGQFQMGNSSTSAAMKVIQEGGKVKFIGENVKNTWTLVGKNTIKSCADLDGKRLGFHSAGSVSTAMYRNWAVKNCAASVKPVEQFINGSPNRLIALNADKLDATMMEVEDTLGLGAGTQVIANFSKTLPEIKTGLVWANNDFLAQNPDIASQYMYELIFLSAELNQNAETFKRLALKHTKGFEDRMDKIIVAYQQANLFPEDPQQFFKELDLTANFFVGAKVLKPGLVAKDMAILQPLNAAINKLKL